MKPDQQLLYPDHHLYKNSSIIMVYTGAWSLYTRRFQCDTLTFIVSRVVIMHLHHCKVLLSNSTHWEGYVLWVGETLYTYNKLRTECIKDL